MTHCAFCHAPLSQPGARFCAKCGREQPAPGSGPQPVVPQGSGPQPAVPQGQPMPPQQPGGFKTTIMSSGGAKLIVQEPGAPPREIPLANQPLTFGRAPDNSIAVDSRFVSKHHARIEPKGPGHSIVDAGSTNGLLFNGQRVPQKDLLDGDVIRVGDPLTGNFVTLTYLNSALSQSTAAIASIGRIDLKTPRVTIGREGNDVNLSNPQVSRHHAEMTVGGGGHVLRDLGSTNGTFVNGHRVNQQQLKRGDVIQIGPFKLVYNETSLDQFDQRGAMRIDAINLMRVVGGSKVILNDVTIVIEPREFVALVGGSGAGKSTLMGALSGFNRATGGAVLVNGDDYYRDFDAYRTVLGYVPQDDILHLTLPVDRALRYAAKLRLPDDTSEAEIEARIKRVLDDVEMGLHRNKRVDNLSGGQRKRVSIASELLADPSLFYLDEPTSGLDPGLEKKMMYTLRQLADSGRTVILVTHATANIRLCDHVAFMADGRLVFYGPPHEALSFFGVTSGDFADIYNKLEGFADDKNQLTHTELRQEFEEWRRRTPQAKEPPRLSELWEIRYRHSECYKRYVVSRVKRPTTMPVAMGSNQPPFQQQMAPPPQPPQQRPPQGMGIVANPPQGAAPANRPKSPPVSSWRQFRILARRYIDLIAADRRNLMILLLQAPIIGALMLLIARADDYSNTISQHGRLTTFILTTVAVWFGILNSAREITKESAVYRRERLANLRIIPYVASKVAVLATLCLIQSVVLMLVLSVKVDFAGNTITQNIQGVNRVGTTPAAASCPPDANGNIFPPGPNDIDKIQQWARECEPREGLFIGVFGGFLVTTFLISLTGMALGLAISALVTSADKAMSIIPFALIPQIIFALALVPLPTAILPVAFLIPSKWGMDAYGSIAGMIPPFDAGGTFPGVAYDYSNSQVLFLWGILLAYTFGLLALTVWLLKRRDKQA